MKHKLLFLTLLGVIVVGMLHFVAGIFYYYWTISWFDSLVHFLAGISIGLLSLWVYFQSGLVKKIIPEKRQAVLKSILFVMIIGVGWEIFEYLNGITEATESYPVDTTLDLIADFLGAMIAGGLASQKKLYESN